MYRQIGFKSVLVHCSRPTKSTSWVGKNVKNALTGYKFMQSISRITWR
jgi:hypothetical protein